MIWQIVLPLGASGGLLGALGVLAVRPSPPLVWREVLLPDELSADQAVALMRHIAAVRQGPVCVSVQAKSGRVQFFLGAPQAALGSVMAAAGGLITGLRFEDAQASDVLGATPTVGALVGWDGPWPLLRTQSPQLTAAGLLGVMASLAGGEQLELRLRLWPAGQVDRPAAASERAQVPANPWFMRSWWPAQPPAEDVGAIRAKYSDLLLDAEVLVRSGAATRALAIANAQRVIAALRTSAGARGVLTYTTIGRAARLRRVIARRRRPLLWESHTLLSPTELVSIAGLPIETPAIAGVSYGTAPRLMAPAAPLPAERAFAASNFPATEGRPLGQPVEGGLQHVLVVGPTGSGKSTLLASLIRADLEAGRGALAIDLKGDLVEEVLRHVPRAREQDIIVLEPARGGAQPGLSLFPARGDPELTSDLVLGTLAEMFHDSWGIRSSQYLGLGLKTLAAVPGATLVDLPLLFTDERFRSRALERIEDRWLRAAWGRFLALSAAERATHLASPLTKLEELVGRGRLRLVLGQRSSKLDFGEVLSEGRIVLVGLPPGLLGMPATRLLSALTLWQFFQAVEGRAGLAPEERQVFFCYVDEVAILGALPLPLEGILERARGHGVGLTLSPQALSQLGGGLRQALLANVGSVIAFGQRSEEEARTLASVLPGVTHAQLQHLGRFEVAMRLSLGPGAVTPTMTGTTLAPGAPVSDPAAIRVQAARRWGQTLEDIEAALARRHGPDEERPEGSRGATSPLGVTRRRS